MRGYEYNKDMDELFCSLNTTQRDCLRAVRRLEDDSEEGPTTTDVWEMVNVKYGATSPDEYRNQGLVITTVGNALNQLNSMGLIERVSSEGSTREKVNRTTDKGLAALRSYSIWPDQDKYDLED